MTKDLRILLRSFHFEFVIINRFEIWTSSKSNTLKPAAVSDGVRGHSF